MKRLLCRMTFRHRGHISHDDLGIFWECSNCHARNYVPWSEAGIGHLEEQA